MSGHYGRRIQQAKPHVTSGLRAKPHVISGLQALPQVTSGLRFWALAHFLDPTQTLQPIPDWQKI
jgi:hypothetical protein